MSWFKRLWILGLGVAAGAATGYVATIFSQRISEFMHERLTQRFGAPSLYVNTSEDILGDAAFIDSLMPINYPDPVVYPDEIIQSGHTLMSALQQLDRIQLFYDENPDPMFDTPNLVNPRLNDENGSEYDD